MSPVLLSLALVQGALVLIVLGVAALLDWRTREAPDGLWQALAVLGLLLGFGTLGTDGPLAWGLWLLVGAFALEHLVPWDTRVEERHPGLATLIEIPIYVVVTVVLVAVGLREGIGSSGLPIPVLEAFASVLIGRGLFEAGLLYGGADAKAFISAGVALPVQSFGSLLPLPASAASVLGLFPFGFDLLMNAALLSVIVPVAIALRNLNSGEFAFPSGFTTYSVPTDELPERFVWVRDRRLVERPTEERPEPETSEEDRQLRVEQRDRLRALGIDRVQVTPQLPFLVFMAAGALLALVAGNLLIDLVALL